MTEPVVVLIYCQHIQEINLIISLKLTLLCKRMVFPTLKIRDSG